MLLAASVKIMTSYVLEAVLPTDVSCPLHCLLVNMPMILPDPVCISRYSEDVVSSDAASGYLIQQCGKDP